MSVYYSRRCAGKGTILALAPSKLSFFPIRFQAGQGGELEPIGGCVVFTLRKGEMVGYETEEDGWVKVVMDVPAKGLIGYMAGEFKNDVHGAGVSSLWLRGLAWFWPSLIFLFYLRRTINHIFKGYKPSRRVIDTARNGALIFDRCG